MENKMGTLTDDKDGKDPPDPLHSPELDKETMDEDRIPDTETPNRKCPTCGRAENSMNFTVKGSENSTIRQSTIIGLSNKTVIKKEKEQDGVTCNVTEGAKPRVKISVPAKDGRTQINVECINGILEQLSYFRKFDTENTFGSRLIFRNIPDGSMADIINEEKSDDFFDLIEKWEERYGCKVYKIYKKCLVIEFRHETEEGRDRMIKEEETVKQMFQTFIEVINPNAPSCTLEVSTDTDKPDTELKHIEQDVSVPSTSKSEKAQAQGMLPPEYKKEERFQSVSDDESEPQLKKEMEYSVERRKHDRFPDEEETSSSFDSDEEETSSSFDSSSFKGARRWASEPGKIREKEPTKSRGKIKERIHVHLEPIPVSQVHLHGCRRCSEVFKNCENELSAVRNLHFIHFNPYKRHDSKLQFTKILSAFRNSEGGVLIVHQRTSRRSVDSLHKFINQILDSVLTNDLVTCDVFKSQQIENCEDMFRIDVEPAEMYVTHDYKTKFPSLSTDKFENASNERIRHLLFSLRTTESTEAALKGISSRQQNVEDLRLRYTRPIPMLSGPSTPSRDMLNVLGYDIDVDDIMTSHSVPEHITSLSKKKSGGSMFVTIAGLTFHDTPLDQQELIKDHLMQALKKNVCVQKNKHSKVSLQDIDVFKIGLSKDADSGGCIIEIAVGHVNGCVFYDPQGPESYKMKGDEIVRLPIEKWVEGAFD